MGLRMRICCIFVMMVVVMIVVVSVMMVMVRFSDAPCHPNRSRNNQGAAEQLKIRLTCQHIRVLSKVQPKQSHGPHYGGMGDGSGKPQEYRLRHRSPHSNDECGHHGFGVARF